MKYLLVFILSSFLLTACRESEFKINYEHDNLIFVEKEALVGMEFHQHVYVPAYSDIYYESHQKKTYLTVILSLRNISFTDTVYFDGIDYYSSEGNLLRNYIDKVMVLHPMESMEFIVEQAEKAGGAGANFVVSYSAKSNLKNPPFIETVMMGSVGNYGFAFSSPGINIKE